MILIKENKPEKEKIIQNIKKHKIEERKIKATDWKTVTLIKENKSEKEKKIINQSKYKKKDGRKI